MPDNGGCHRNAPGVTGMPRNAHGLRSADAEVVGSAIEQGIEVLTRDKQILRKVPGVAKGF